MFRREQTLIELVKDKLYKNLTDDLEDQYLIESIESFLVDYGINFENYIDSIDLYETNDKKLVTEALNQADLDFSYTVDKYGNIFISIKDIYEGLDLSQEDDESDEDFFDRCVDETWELYNEYSYRLENYFSVDPFETEIEKTISLIKK